MSAVPSRKGSMAMALISVMVALGILALIRSAGQAGLPPAGDFTLQSTEGLVSLKDFRGRVVLIFFGYMGCPGVCPTALSDEAAAFRALAPEELARVAGLFVSLDPERDSPAALKAYARDFHPRIQGVTGSPDALRAVAWRYGVVYEKQAPDEGGAYAVDHTAEIYVISPQGRLLARLPQNSPPESILVEIRRALRER